MTSPLPPLLLGAGYVDLGGGMPIGRELGADGIIIAGADDVGAGGAPYACPTGPGG